VPGEAIVYLVATGILVATILLFFGLAKGRYADFGVVQIVLRVIVAMPLLASATYVHFLHTNEATAMLPTGFPATEFLVLVTGACEMLGAIGLFIPPAQRSAAACIAIMMVLIFPVNINIAGQTFFGFTMPSVSVRLVMQMIYIWMVLLAGYGRPRFQTALSNR
jgi:uncharacterized membrane protein